MAQLPFDIHPGPGHPPERFEADNWLDALRLWLRTQGRTAAGLGFDLMADDSVVVTDPTDGFACRVVPARTRRSATGPLVQAPTRAQSVAAEPVDELADPFLDDSIEDAPPPAPIIRPERATSPQRATRSLEEALESLAGLDAHTASARALDACRATFPCEAASVLLIDARRRSLYFAVARGPEAAALRTQRVPLEVGLAGACIRTRRSINITDPANDPRFARTIADTVGRIPRAMVVVPVLHARRVFGVLELLDPRPGPAFSADEEARVRRAGRRLGAHLAGLAGHADREG